MKLKSVNFVVVAVLAIFIFSMAGASNIDDLKMKDVTNSGEKRYPPMILDHGGPDGGGYYYIDSDDEAMNAPVFNWVDISGIGTPVTLTDDDNEGPFDIGFEFTFYGNAFTTVNICSNGFVSFTSTSYSLSNSSIPNGPEPNNLLAVFWDDLNPANGGTVYYYHDSENNCFIVSYDGVPHYSNYGSLFFQVILYDDGTIIYQYDIMDDGGHGNDGATVGIENASGTIGTEYLYNQEGIHNEMAIYFGFEPPLFGSYNVCPTAFISPGGMGQVGDPVTPEVRFANIGLETVTFDVRLIVELDGSELYNETETVVDLSSGENEDVAFPDFTPGEEGTFILTAISELANDEDPDNDTLEHSFQTFAQIVYYDFESNGVFESSDGIWEWGTPTSGPGGAYSGVNLWATVLGGNYPTNTLTLLTTLPFGLSADAVLGFWHWYDTEARYDGGNVKISTDEGATWTVIVPDGGYDDVANSFNPLSGEEIFTGHNVGEVWQFETFDLSAYAGQSAIFRFDFGSDGSVQYPGWYVDDFTLMGGGGVEPGWITGVVTNNLSGDPIEGAIVQTGGTSDETGADGVYTLELFPGTYSITASAEYHNPLTVPGVVVEEDETTTQDFALTAPMMQMDDSPIDVQMNHGEIQTVYREISNTGDGELEFNISVIYDDGMINAREPSFADEPVIGQADQSVVEAKNAIPADESAIAHNGNSNGEPPAILDFGDEVAYFNLQGECGDNQLLGAVFALDHFWVSGGNNGGDPNNLYQFDRSGSLVDIHIQGTSGWGWLDLTWDGQYIYGTDFNTDIISQFDPATGEIVGTVPNPTAAGLGIAYDPATDHFWGINWWGSNIIEFDRDGNIINSYSQSPLSSAFGIAWDDVSPDGPWLWVFSQETGAELTVAQFDPINGYMTGVQFMAIDHDGGDIAGGLGFTREWDPAFGLLICLGQATVNDWIGLYELAEAVNWLVIDPMSGTVAPAESEDIEFTFDMTDVPDTVLFLGATVNVASNSPVTVSIDVNVDLTTGIEGPEGYLPISFSLDQNYPNPFNARTEIMFAIPEAANVDLTVYNTLGQKVATLVSGKMDAGYHKVNWNASSISSGIYFYKLTAGDQTEVREMTLIK